MNDHNPPNINAEGTDNAISNVGGDDLDLESMWDDVSWNEIQNVETEEYEVEKITPNGVQKTNFHYISMARHIPRMCFPTKYLQCFVAVGRLLLC